MPAPLFGKTASPNLAALYGAILVTVAVTVLSDLTRWFATQQPWPTTAEGWLHVLLPSLCAGLLAALTPYVQKPPPTP